MALPVPDTDPVPTDPNVEIRTLLRRIVVLYVHKGAPELAYGSLRTPWTSDTPVVADAAAAVIAGVPQAFPHLPITAESLRQEMTEAEQAFEIKQAFEKLLRWATASLSDARARLYEHTQTAVDSIRSAQGGHVLSVEDRAQVEVAAAKLEGRLAARSTGLKASRRDTENQRSESDERVAEVEGKLAAKELELSITRGGTVDAPAVLAARSARKRPAGRRSRR